MPVLGPSTCRTCAISSSPRSIVQTIIQPLIAPMFLAILESACALMRNISLMNRICDFQSNYILQVLQDIGWKYFIS